MGETSIKQTWVAEMAALLVKAGYKGEDAEPLYDEGMGPLELTQRLEEPGGLTRTHRLLQPNMKRGAGAAAGGYVGWAQRENDYRNGPVRATPEEASADADALSVAIVRGDPAVAEEDDMDLWQACSMALLADVDPLLIGEAETAGADAEPWEAFCDRLREALASHGPGTLAVLESVYDRARAAGLGAAKHRTELQLLRWARELVGRLGVDQSTTATRQHVWGAVANIPLGMRGLLRTMTEEIRNEADPDDARIAAISELAALVGGFDMLPGGPAPLRSVARRIEARAKDLLVTAMTSPQ